MKLMDVWVQGREHEGVFTYDRREGSAWGSGRECDRNAHIGSTACEYGQGRRQRG